MQPLRRPITQSICLLCSSLQACRGKSSSAGASATPPRGSKPAPAPLSRGPDPVDRPPKSHKRKPKAKPPAQQTATTQPGVYEKDASDILKIRQVGREILGHNKKGRPKERKNADVDKRKGSKTTAALGGLGTLPSFTSRQHIPATGTTGNSKWSSSAEPEYPPEPTRPPSFVPRISIPAEELIARQARTRALEEWSDLEIDLETTTPEFLPSISEYSPTPSPRPPPARYVRSLRDIYPQPDGVGDGEEPTRHLHLRNIGTTPLPSDIYRLIADKEHIPRWRNEEVHFSAFWGRNPRTLNKEGGYHLVWPEGSYGQLSDAGMEQREGILTRKGAGRGRAENRAEAFRKSFVAAVREGDRFPAAIHARGGFSLGTPTKSTLEGTDTTATTATATSTATATATTTATATAAATTTATATNSTPLQQHPPVRILRPHQTVPLPYPSPNPSASYIPTKQLIHGNILYLNLLISSRPPCPPGCAVLLSTSSQGGTTPTTGKIPRTREILGRLMAEEFELIGSITHDTSPHERVPQTQKHKNQGAGVQDDDPPDAASVGGTNSLDQLSDYIPNFQHFANRGKWNTESLLVGANEERFGVTRFVMTKEEDAGPFTRERKRKESGRKAAEKRQIVGAEGKWVVRLVSRVEAGRLVRAWHMREFWTGIGGDRAEKVVMRAEIL